jgi:hypothetical protein
MVGSYLLLRRQIVRACAASPFRAGRADDVMM